MGVSCGVSGCATGSQEVVDFLVSYLVKN
jgi:hypothetical protein